METTDRVRAQTATEINDRIDAQTRNRLIRAAGAPPAVLGRLIADLEEEWTSSGTLLGAFVNKKFLLLPALVLPFLLQHALQGWCPPLPFFGARESAPGKKSRPRKTPSRRCAATLPISSAMGVPPPMPAPPGGPPPPEPLFVRPERAGSVPHKCRATPSAPHDSHTSRAPRPRAAWRMSKGKARAAACDKAPD